MENPMDQVNSINNFDKREQKGFYSNTYNPSWKNHPNLFWGGNQQGTSYGNQWSNQGAHNNSYQYQPQRNAPHYQHQNYQPPQQHGNQYNNQARDSRSNDSGTQGLEKMMQTMMAKMDSNHASQEQRFSKIEASIDEINVHRKMLEGQISQIAQQVASLPSTPTYDKGKLPSQPQPNPRGECKSISTSNVECHCISIVEVGDMEECKGLVLRSGKVMGNSKKNKVTKSESVENEDSEWGIGCKRGEDKSKDKNEEVSLEKGGVENESSEEKDSEKDKRGVEEFVPNEAYAPKLPFPQKHIKAKLDEQFGKFLEILKNIYIDIPFVEAVKQMPNFVKFLKDFVIKRKCVEDCKVVNLSRELSDAIQNKLPPKLKDPGSFNIPTNVGKMYARKSLCDLGASVSIVPMNMMDKIGDGVLRPSNIALKLADESIRYPIGILEDVKVKVGKLVISIDFIVIDEKGSDTMPVILGRPFLATAGANIDVQGGRITFKVNGEECEFKLPKNLHQSMELVKESFRVEASNVKKEDLGVDQKKENKEKENPKIEKMVMNSKVMEWKAKSSSQIKSCAYRIKRILPNGMLEIWNKDLGTRNIKIEDVEVIIGDNEGTTQPPSAPPNK